MSGADFRPLLHFWFAEQAGRHFAADPQLDRAIAERFGDLHRRAALCELWPWRASADGRLAEILLLDQFSRNIHRGRAAAFACDPLALALAQEAVAGGHDQSLPPQRRTFIYMPYMHSESPAIQKQALKLFGQPGLERSLHYARLHSDIIARFGRYPHRNAILGRDSTPAEQAFLKTENSSF